MDGRRDAGQSLPTESTLANDEVQEKRLREESAYRQLVGIGPLGDAALARHGRRRGSCVELV